MERVPARELHRNFQDNYWLGFGVVALTAVLVVFTSFVVIDVFFHVPIFQVLLGGHPKDAHKKPLAIGLLAAGVGCVLIALLYYMHRQGGLVGVGADALQTGERYNPVLTDTMKEYDTSAKVLRRDARQRALERLSYIDAKGE